MSAAEQRPFFPLSVVAFPLAPFKLHIFEPRYQQLFNELVPGKGTFVQVPVIDSRLQSHATLVRLEHVARHYASGELDVDCVGVGVVRVQSFDESLDGKLYGGGDVTPVRTTLAASDIHLTELLLDRCRELLLALEVTRELPEAEDPGVSYLLGSWLGLKLHEAYALLTMATEDQREMHLLDLVNVRLEAAKATAELRQRVQLNGQFRYFSTDNS